MENIIKYINNYSGKIIYVTSSVYNTMLAVSILLQTDKKPESIIIMTTPHKDEVKQFTSISTRMEYEKINNIVIDKKTRVHRAIGISSVSNNIIKKRVYQILDTSKHNFLLVNFSWAQKKVAYPASIYLDECEKAIFIQEGVMQYVTPDDNNFYLLLKKLYGNQTNFWTMDKIEGIYVTDPEKFPNYLHPKLIKANFNYCENQADIISKIFLSEEERKELSELKTADGIIFTQPLSEDGFISEKEKTNIYLKIKTVCDQYGKFVIKLHPRDTSDYDIDKSLLISGKYPSEIFKLNHIKFKYAVGICTSAIATIDADHAFNINENFLFDKKINFEDIDLKLKAIQYKNHGKI